MNLSRARLYSLLLFLSACGYLWLFVSYHIDLLGEWSGCWFRYLFHIPCPSCGNTRAVHAAFQGDWFASLYYNPLGLLLAALMVVVPVWIVVDLLKGSSSFLHAYQTIEEKLRSWTYALPCIIAIVINWIWNLVKYT